MAKIRIEWVPVQTLGLGRFGFDHLQLVYQPSELDERRTGQDNWFVMEGVREASADGPHLGIEGSDGRTTLAVANLAAREALIEKIGTPQERGSRSLDFGGDEFQAWETMASYARDVEAQDFPYIAYGLPGSPTPTINSSSAIASLIWHAGLDPSDHLPHGIRLSPGTSTLIGTTADDIMRIEHGFTTLLGGRGNDEFEGTHDPHQIEKLYGGAGDDLFLWSAGFNIIHGGQPKIRYGADGTDVVDYSGAGTVTVTLNPYWVPDKVPNYVVQLDNGLDHLYSIERIQWNEASDHIVLGKGVDLIEDDVILEPNLQSLNHGNPTDDPHFRSGKLLAGTQLAGEELRTATGGVLPDGFAYLELLDGAANGRGNDDPNRLVGNRADNTLEGLDGDDTLYGGAGDDTLQGGPGDDGYVYLYGDGDDVIIERAGEGTADLLVLAGDIKPHDVSFFRIPEAANDLLLKLAKGGSILITNFFGPDACGIESIHFDRAPAWTRKDLLDLAEAAPLLDGNVTYVADDTLLFRPELTGPSGAQPADTMVFEVEHEPPMLGLASAADNEALAPLSDSSWFGASDPEPF